MSDTLRDIAAVLDQYSADVLKKIRRSLSSVEGGLLA